MERSVIQLQINVYLLSLSGVMITQLYTLVKIHLRSIHMSTSSKKKNSGVQKKIREEIYTQSTNTNGEKLTLYKQRSQ